MEDFRTMPTGATRDTNNNKLEYSSYSHPLNDFSFAKYMQSKQTIWWKYRRWDNWQLGLGREVLLDSLIRHIKTLELLFKGYRLFETKKDWVVDLIVLKKDHIFDDTAYDFCEEKTMEETLNAIRFNSEAMKLDYLSDNYTI